MAAETLHADLELFLTSWYRTTLSGRPEPFLAAGVEVDRVERDSAHLLVVIRDDGGANDLYLTGERQVGLTVLGGTPENPTNVLAFARLVVALTTRIPGIEPGNPVAAVTESNGPYLVPEDSERARAYATVTFRVVGTPLI